MQPKTNIDKTLDVEKREERKFNTIEGIRRGKHNCIQILYEDEFRLVQAFVFKFKQFKKKIPLCELLSHQRETGNDFVI